MAGFEVWGHGPFAASDAAFDQHQLTGQYSAPAPRVPYPGNRHGPIGQPIRSMHSTNFPPPAPFLSYYSSQLGGFVRDVKVQDVSSDMPWSAQNQWTPADQAWGAADSSFAPFGEYQPQSVPKARPQKSYPDDDDHPSFARPPHRAVSKVTSTRVRGAASATSKVIEVVSIPAPESLIPEEEILVPNSYPVPPPPPHAQSAAPLAEFAAEMVWNRCFVQQLGPRHDYLSRGYTGSAPNSPNCFPSIWISRPNASIGRERRTTVESPGSGNFGAIGVEAKARRASRQNNKASTPQTAPPSDLTSTSKAGVKPAFRRWSKQILEATLLAPQVLLLALMYVEAVNGKDVFGESKNQMTPYKMMMAALVLANKTLDDHSYKNSTFANVSSMTNTEVNNVELALLIALDFNTVPMEEEWVAWLHDIVDSGERMGFKLSGTKIDGMVPLTLPSTRVEKIEATKVNLPLTRSLSFLSNQESREFFFLGPTTRSSSFCGAIENVKGGWDGCSSMTAHVEQRRFGQELSNRQAMVSF